MTAVQGEVESFLTGRLKPGTKPEHVDQARSVIRARDPEAEKELQLKVNQDPWGPLARAVEHIVIGDGDLPREAAQRWIGVIDAARDRANDADRRQVALILSDAARRAGVPQRVFATRLGTTPSRFSTYVSGKATPSAAFLIRANRVADALAKSGPSRNRPNAATAH